MRKILNRINGLISAKIESRVQKGAQDAMLFKCTSKNRISAKIANYEGTGAGVTDNVSERGDSRISALCNVVSKTHRGVTRTLTVHAGRDLLNWRTRPCDA